ncbi:hypothetical protein [Devosia marina]|uniref:Uncharacterized protein n=1 Tax=Devosia marina TaxID=2683198 RepID=A0A7X3K3E6_9HYPH|nr:hypothetical protein [Devosia marina]MVS98885.1 hypothetical protein [Devosia marina]
MSDHATEFARLDAEDRANPMLRHAGDVPPPVQRLKARRGSHYLDDRFVGLMRDAIDAGGPVVIEVERSWVEARKLGHWIEREYDIDDYEMIIVDDEIIERPRRDEPVIELGPDEEPF